MNSMRYIDSEDWCRFVLTIDSKVLKVDAKSSSTKEKACTIKLCVGLTSLTISRKEKVRQCLGETFVLLEAEDPSSVSGEEWNLLLLSLNCFFGKS